MNESLAARARRFELLNRVGIALGAEHNKDRLIEMILIEAKQVCNADGGTLYLRTADDHLRFAIMRTDSLGIASGGTTGTESVLPPIPLTDPVSGAPNLENVATYAALEKRSIHIPDAYDHEGFDFSGTKAFDRRNNYRSTSLLTIPLLNGEREVIGVLQLLNARHPVSGEVRAFPQEDQGIVEALAAQAGIAIDNQLLLEGQRELLESFIKMIAAAIDSKSPYTGGHCERVPILTEMIAESVCSTTSGPFAAFDLTEEEWYELRIAAWMHDCGKVTTPVHVMDKATKLETIFDRIEVVQSRFETLRRDAKIRCLERIAAGDADPERAAADYDAEVQELDEELAFLERANIGSEFLSQADGDRIRAIGQRTLEQAGRVRPLLGDDEIENLCVSRGTLTDRERLIINGHMVQTIRMLEALPFPRNLRRVPEYAGGHHERMDGTGYPRGIYAGDMSVPARIMAIADVFEALTATDRPYKKGKPLSEAMSIMGKMKRHNHLDPALFDLFVQSGVYRRYAEHFLPRALIDEVDEATLLAISPEPFDAPEAELRKRRWNTFLPDYENL